MSEVGYPIIQYGFYASMEIEPQGEYVLYTSHLAAVEEARREAFRQVVRGYTANAPSASLDPDFLAWILKESGSSLEEIHEEFNRRARGEGGKG